MKITWEELIRLIRTLVTERLELRAVEKTDEAFIQHFMDDEERMRYLPLGRAGTAEEARSSTTKRLAHWRRHGFGCFLVRLHGMDEPMGYCGLEFAGDSKRVEIVYGFLQSVWGKGYATEAALACVRYGLCELGLQVIYGSVLPANTASEAVLQKLGMKQTTADSSSDPLRYYVIHRNDLAQEPLRLKRGKRFHTSVQAEWEDAAAGVVSREKAVTKLNGRTGRIDIYVEADDALAAVVEIKHSDWDAMTPEAVRCNAKRYARQVWNYIESQLEEGKKVSPGVIFPVRPLTPGRLEQVERLFDEEGIPVVWQDESIEDLRNRKGAE